VLLEKFSVFGYGAKLSPKVRDVLEEYERVMAAKRTKAESTAIVVQAVLTPLSRERKR